MTKLQEIVRLLGGGKETRNVRPEFGDLFKPVATGLLEDSGRKLEERITAFQRTAQVSSDVPARQETHTASAGKF